MVILLVEFNALTTFELKLNPATFILPPVMLPVALTMPPVSTLPPVTFAVTVNALRVPTLVILV